jgi:hypothetical protein
MKEGSEGAVILRRKNFGFLADGGEVEDIPVFMVNIKYSDTRVST